MATALKVLLELGLRLSEYVVFDPKDEQTNAQVSEFVGETAIEWAGIKHDLSGLVLIKLNPEEEESNGPGFTESVIIHEAVGHGSSDPPTYLLKTTQQSNGAYDIEQTHLRSGFGFVQEDEGLFLEEAFS